MIKTKERRQKNILIMGKEAQTIELSTDSGINYIPCCSIVLMCYNALYKVRFNALYTLLPTVLKKLIMTEPNIELLNTDCLLYMKQCKDKQFDWAIVDPPYGINYDKEQNKQAENERISNGGKWKKYHNTNWDSSVPELEYWNELFRISKNQIVWGGNYFFDVNLTGVIIWNKGENGTMKQGELAKCSKNTFKIYNKSRIDAYVNSGEPKIHPCQKPISLYEWLLDNYVSENDKIIDTHLGSGSIAVACYNRKIDLVGIEIDKTYFDKANKKLKDRKNTPTLF